MTLILASLSSEWIYSYIVHLDEAARGSIMSYSSYNDSYDYHGDESAYDALESEKKDLRDLSWTACKFNDYIFESLNAFGVLITLILSIDRLYAIARPMQIRMFATYLYPKLISLILYFVILAVQSPVLFFTHPVYNKQFSDIFILFPLSRIIKLNNNKILFIHFFFIKGKLKTKKI